MTPQVARNLHMGDYTNLSIKLDIDLGGPGCRLPDPTDAGIPLEDIPDAVPASRDSPASSARTC